MAKEDVKEAFVYNFTYEMSESTWKASIAGFSQEECVECLYRLVPGRIMKIVSTQQAGRLDAISDALRNDITMPEQLKINELLSEMSLLKKAKDLRTIPRKKD